MPEMLSTCEELINYRRQEGKWNEKSPEESRKIIKKISDEMDAFRFENQQKASASQEEMASLVFTA